MKISIPSLILILLAALPLTVTAAEPEVIYWNSDAGKVLRARIAPDEDYWQFIPRFTNQRELMGAASIALRSDRMKSGSDFDALR